MPGRKIELEVVGDNVETADATGVIEAVPTADYEVTAEAGIFKMGRQYDQGATVTLPVATGERLIEAGDIKVKESR